jgi:hypothetical protein
MKSYDKIFFPPLFCCCFWIRDPVWVKIGIRDKHPGSATLEMYLIYFFFLLRTVYYWYFLSVLQIRVHLIRISNLG